MTCWPVGVFVVDDEHLSRHTVEKSLASFRDSMTVVLAEANRRATPLTILKHEKSSKSVVAEFARLPMHYVEGRNSCEFRYQNP